MYHWGLWGYHHPNTELSGRECNNVQPNSSQSFNILTPHKSDIITSQFIYMYAEALCTEFNKLTELTVLRNISKRLKDNIHRRKTHYELQENSFATTCLHEDNRYLSAWYLVYQISHYLRQLCLCCKIVGILYNTTQQFDLSAKKMVT